MSNSAVPEPVEASRSSSHPYQLLLLLLACGALLYGRSLSYDFVYDDVSQIVKNPRITAWSYLPSYFSEQLWAGIQSASYYRPMLLLWMRTNHFLFGLNPVGWHAASVLLHVGATALAFALARRMLQSAHAALVAAAIFMLHPLQVESVVWLSAANEALAAIFIFASYLFFLKSREQASSRKRGLLLSWMTFALALLTKETAVIVPAMIVLFAFFYPVDSRRRLTPAFAAAIPYALILAGYLVIRKLVLAQVSPSELRTDPLTALFTMPSVALLYLEHLFVPWKLAMLYDTRYVEHLSSAGFAVPIVLLMALAATAIWLWRKTRSAAIAIGLLWIPVHVAIPLLTLPFFRNVDLSHDRYLYVPSFGFALLIGTAWQHARESLLRNALLTSLLLVYVLTTFYQQQFWRNDAALFAHSQQVSPGAYLAKVLDGQELALQKRYSEALPLLESSVQQHPRALAGLVVLAYTRCEMGETRTAEQLFARALALQPESAETNYALGLCRLMHGGRFEAIPPLQVAVYHLPDNMEYRLALGRALVLAGRKREAIGHFRVAESLAPASERPALHGYIQRLSAVTGQ